MRRLFLTVIAALFVAAVLAPSALAARPVPLHITGLTATSAGLPYVSDGDTDTCRIDVTVTYAGKYVRGAYVSLLFRTATDPYVGDAPMHITRKSTSATSHFMTSSSIDLATAGSYYFELQLARYNMGAIAGTLRTTDTIWLPAGCPAAGLQLVNQTWTS